MKLDDLLSFEYVTIQCHDNPDADAIGSGYALYKFFAAKGKKVRFIYSGKNVIQKSNLKLLVDSLSIPIEYREKHEEINNPLDLWKKGLWLTVDCQYGAGNVTKFDAEHVAIIDHHQIEIGDVEFSIIRPDLGSCATLVYELLKEAGYEVTDDEGVGTALYYGLFTDTNQFAELFNPLDRDMSDQVPHDSSFITTLRTTNISLNELEIAGVAMLRYSFNEEYGFAVIKSQPCDPNILGLISDFLLQVDKVKTCIVFNESDDGFKLSVRSCVKEVNACELVSYITEGIGSGGGHYEKAGGFIAEKLFREKYGPVNIDTFLSNKLMEYHDTFPVIYASQYEADISQMTLYRKKKLPLGFVMATDILPEGMPITVRSLEGDMDLTVEKDLIIMIGVKGEVYPNRLAKFQKSNEVLDKKYVYSECVIEENYIPTIKNRVTGQNHLLTDYAKVCVPTGDVKIYVKKLDKGIKIFTAWDKEKYMLGKPGDYMAVRCDDLHDIYIIENKIFGITYEKVEE